MPRSPSVFPPLMARSMVAGRRAGLAVITIVTLSLILVTGGIAMAAAVVTEPPETADEVAAVYRWILIVSVPALVSAIIFLWRALAESQKTIIGEIKSAQPQREEHLLAIKEMTAAAKEMVTTVRYCRERISIESGGSS